MKALTVLAWFTGIILVVFVILLMAAPTKVHIEKSQTINAPVQVVWDYITRFEKFNQWSTWRKIEPEAQYRIEGVDGTVGAATSWKGKKLGEGRLEHLSLKPFTEVRQRLQFFEPFEGTSDVYYLVREAAGVTTVTWGIDAAYPRPQNIMGMFMKRSLENDFSQGLLNLKNAVEAEKTVPQLPATATSPAAKEGERPEMAYWTVRSEVSTKDISGFYAASLPRIFKAVNEARLSPGVPAGLYYSWDEKAGKTDMAAAVTLEAKGTPPAGITAVTLPAGKIVYVDFYGPYERTAEAHALIEKYLREKGRTSKWPVLEEYITDPATEKDSTKWLTRVVYYAD